MIGVSLIHSDIDECTMDTFLCHNNATCIDTDGSYECICKGGYSGNGTSCIGKLKITL